MHVLLIKTPKLKAWYFVAKIQQYVLRINTRVSVDTKYFHDLFIPTVHEVSNFTKKWFLQLEIYRHMHYMLVSIYIIKWSII